MADATDLEIIVLAAGKGTRMHSEKPKVLHTLCGVTLLERTLRAAAGLRPKSIVVVVGYGRELLAAELERLKAQPHFQGIALESVFQEHQQGTGHAARVGLTKVTGSCKRVLVLPGDSPLLETATLELLTSQGIGEDTVLSFLTTELEKPEGFGRIVRANDGTVQKIVEQKDCSSSEAAIKEINASIYLAERTFLAEALGALQPNNAQGELYLTDIVSYAVAKGLWMRAALVSNASSVLGANTRGELSELETHRRAAINRDWMEYGVTLEDPQATYIDEDVVLAQDCFLGAGVRLQGTTRIGPGTVIEGDSLIRNTTVGAGCTLKLSCYFDQAIVEENCQVGPFVHLRPGTILHNGVRIGNFVEVKNSELGAGAKANHLTYLGDARIGTNANIGAGTITCNYDGIHKHRTTIGAGAFIGSNSALVAPVEVGAGAYVGAGSTIVKDVPSEALAVARSPQKNIEGWASRKAKQK